jgi:hypothetical protein
MKDKLLFGTIGLLVGIVVMQWTMPNGNASITSTPPVGGVVCLDQGTVLMSDASMWVIGAVSGQDGWIQTGTLPMSPSQVLYFDGGRNVVDKNGDFWSDRDQGWHNYGKPPVTPLASGESTWGKVKEKFRAKDGKP